ncbi:hypothetical protein GCM10011607_28910 [Shewanella inventionis]|uniref:Uncharacterized protein n=1 Tax=Shewanella inventionis TaxID=1738770 RepID=A0ABQ1JDX8_9GAMM|nr:hypothetical protein [Shewanella inventionis]GGB66501.1 hypothetical protein GCM10011607_28910 [Shewanella inventionis]
MHLYVLELDQNNYFVNSSADVGKALWLNFEQVDDLGSEWLSIFHPKRVVHLSEIGAAKHNDISKIVDQCTLRLAKKFGFEHVRGGSFQSNTEYAYPSLWDLFLTDDIPPADLSKMKPVSALWVNN